MWYMEGDRIRFLENGMYEMATLFFVICPCHITMLRFISTYIYSFLELTYTFVGVSGRERVYPCLFASGIFIFPPFFYSTSVLIPRRCSLVHSFVCSQLAHCEWEKVLFAKALGSIAGLWLLHNFSSLIAKSLLAKPSRIKLKKKNTHTHTHTHTHTVCS